MPRSLILGIFFTLILSSQLIYAEQILSKKEYYDTGEIKSERNIFSGLFKKYYKNGKLAYEGKYTLSRLPNGLHKIYLSDGSLSQTVLYKDGIWVDEKGIPQDGIIKTYYENGQVNIEDPYIRGKRHGIYRAFNEDGGLLAEGEWKESLQDGFMRAYDKTGKVTFETYFQKGELLPKEK